MDNGREHCCQCNTWLGRRYDGHRGLCHACRQTFTWLLDNVAQEREADVGKIYKLEREKEGLHRNIRYLEFRIDMIIKCCDHYDALASNGIYDEGRVIEWIRNHARMTGPGLRAWAMMEAK